jgi:hypothetical protein
MNKEDIIELLKEHKQKEAQLKLKENAKKRKELNLQELKEIGYNPKITPTYSEGGKSNLVNSKVEQDVINLDEKISSLKKEIKELEKEIEILRLDVDEINIRLGALTYLEKELLTDYYINKMSLEDIGNITYYRVKHQTRSESTVKRKIETIIEKMSKI